MNPYETISKTLLQASHSYRAGIPCGDMPSQQTFSVAFTFNKAREAAIDKAIDRLHDMIDGGEECRGMDAEISDIIRILTSVK